MKDPYATLGVSRDATAEEITAAYRRLAREYHPDRNPGNAVAEQRMKEINAAYDVLKNGKSSFKGDTSRQYGNPYGYGTHSGNSWGGPPYASPRYTYDTYREHSPFGFSLFTRIVGVLLALQLLSAMGSCVMQGLLGDYRYDSYGAQRGTAFSAEYSATDGGRE